MVYWLYNKKVPRDNIILSLGTFLQHTAKYGYTKKQHLGFSPDVVLKYFILFEIRN